MVLVAGKDPYFHRIRLAQDDIGRYATSVEYVTAKHWKCDPIIRYFCRRGMILGALEPDALDRRSLRYGLRPAPSVDAVLPRLVLPRDDARRGALLEKA